MCCYLDFKVFISLLRSTERLFSKTYLSFNAFHRLIKPSNRTHKLDPLASGNAQPIWLAQACTLFGIHYMKPGSPRRRLLDREMGMWDWLGPCYPLSLGHSDWFWAWRWTHRIGWAHPLPHHQITVIGSGQRVWGHGIQAWLMRSSLGVVCGL